ncbi:unnamed protein product [Boreogadus saida]
MPNPISRRVAAGHPCYSEAQAPLHIIGITECPVFDALRRPSSVATSSAASTSGSDPHPSTALSARRVAAGHPCYSEAQAPLHIIGITECPVFDALRRPSSVATSSAASTSGSDPHPSTALSVYLTCSDRGSASSPGNTTEVKVFHNNSPLKDTGELRADGRTPCERAVWAPRRRKPVIGVRLCICPLGGRLPWWPLVAPRRAPVTLAQGDELLSSYCLRGGHYRTGSVSDSLRTDTLLYKTTPTEAYLRPTMNRPDGGTS